MIRATGRAVWVAIVNAVAAHLPDDPYTSRLRAHLYRLLRTRVGRAPTMKGGTRVNGYGLRIGDRVFVNRHCYFDLSAPVDLGNDVVVGHHTFFVTASHEIGDARRRAGAVKPAPIVVEDGVWIGCRSTILPGVRLGRGSVIAAGSMVVRDVPANTLVGGVPARELRRLDAADGTAGAEES